MKISMQTPFQKSHSKSLKKILLAGTAIVVINSIQSLSYADEAEERQRDALHLRTMDILKEPAFAPGVPEGAKLKDVMKFKDQEERKLGLMAQGRDPKMAKTDVVQAIAPGNMIADVNFKGLESQKVKEFSLGPYGLEGAVPFKFEEVSQKKGFWETLSSVFTAYVTGALDYYNTPSTVKDFEAEAVADNFVESRRIRENVLSKLKFDIANNFYERAAVGEYLSRNLEVEFINPIKVIDNLTANSIMSTNFDKAGAYSGIVENAMSLEYLTFSGQYFGQLPVGAVNAPLATRKLNLQATSPFIEEQRRAYAMYRYGID